MIGRGNQTQLKQQHRKEFYRTWGRIAHFVRKKPQNNWISGPTRLMDLTAGDGAASSKMMLKMAYRWLDPNFEVYLFEQTKKHCKQIPENLKHLLDERTEVIPGDHKDTIPQLVKSWYEKKSTILGLVDHDSNGILHMKDYDFLKWFAKIFRTIDILIYTQIGSHNRVVGYNKKQKACFAGGLCESIEFYMLKIPKKHWLIRESYGSNKYVFFFGCNWPGFPELQHIEFYALDSEKGQEILHG